LRAPRQGEVTEGNSPKPCSEAKFSIWSKSYLCHRRCQWRDRHAATAYQPDSVARDHILPWRRMLV